jgi:hypothetical protein
MWLRNVTGGALLYVSLTGCSGAGAPPAERTPEAVVGALAQWSPPADAPRFCAVLARAEHVDDVPEALGRLLAEPTDAEPASLLTRTGAELRTARDAVRWEVGYEDLAADLTDVVDALTVAASGAVDQVVIERIATGLAAVGGQVQGVCEYSA